MRYSMDIAAHRAPSLLSQGSPVIPNRIPRWLTFLFLGGEIFSPLSQAAPADSTSGMVASAQHLASEVGAEVLAHGGNAIDAAVAVGYALAVTHPCCGNIGGGGFMTIHLADGRHTFLNFREKAPLAARPGMYLDAAGNPIDNKSLDGYL